jgi:hypothetical protein
MDKNTKAAIIIDAATKTADELRSEGKSNLADQTMNAFKDVPVGSLAKFYDIIMAYPTKRAALEAVGADA